MRTRYTAPSPSGAYGLAHLPTTRAGFASACPVRRIWNASPPRSAPCAERPRHDYRRSPDVDHLCLYAEGSRQTLRRQHRTRLAVGNDAAAVDDNDPVGAPHCKVEVME